MIGKASPFRSDLKPLDALLFGKNEIPAGESVQSILLDKLFPFHAHPFKPYGEEKMSDMVASILEHGVITPLIVRPHPSEPAAYYEIISGHNRHEAARRAGLHEVPAIVRKADDTAAILMMIASNLEQRDELLPSEKAFAYRMQLQSLNHQGQRNDLHKTNAAHGQLDQKMRVPMSRDLLAEMAGESSRQIHRYVRLTRLIPPLLARVDGKSIPFIAAVDLSHLTREQQTMLDKRLMAEAIKTVTNAQATRMKELSQTGALDESAILRILKGEHVRVLKSIKMTKRLRVYFPESMQAVEIENMIISALEMRYPMIDRTPVGVANVTNT